MYGIENEPIAKNALQERLNIENRNTIRCFIYT